jgi:hypothetical protein
MGDFLETLTLSQLREIAKEENFKGYYKMQKLDLVDLLVNHLQSTKFSKYKLKYQTTKSDDKGFYMIKPKVMVDKTKYRSFSRMELTSILYLMHKYPEHCVAFSTGLLTPSGKLTSRALGLRPTEFDMISLVWSEFKNDFIIPEGLWASIKKCLRGSEFIIIPFGFYCSNGNHSNFLIYNSITKELERFEPYGYINSPYCKNIPMLDEKLAKLFNKNVNKDMVKAIYDPLSFCPMDSFQMIQEDDTEFQEQQGENGPFGYCSAWSFWYADMRLANPLKSRSEVVLLSLQAIKDNNITFTTFIRSYADFLQKVYEKIYYNTDEYPEKIIKKILKKNEQSK